MNSLIVDKLQGVYYIKTKAFHLQLVEHEKRMSSQMNKRVRSCSMIYSLTWEKCKNSKHPHKLKHDDYKMDRNYHLMHVSLGSRKQNNKMRWGTSGYAICYAICKITGIHIYYFIAKKGKNGNFKKHVDIWNTIRKMI